MEGLCMSFLMRSTQLRHWLTGSGFEVRPNIGGHQMLNVSCATFSRVRCLSRFVAWCSRWFWGPALGILETLRDFCPAALGSILDRHQWSYCPCHSPQQRPKKRHWWSAWHICSRSLKCRQRRRKCCYKRLRFVESLRGCGSRSCSWTTCSAEELDPWAGSCHTPRLTLGNSFELWSVWSGW